MSPRRKPVALDAGTMPISLGGRIFAVPRLPLGVTIAVYPICQRLTNAGLDLRILSGQGATEEEMSDLTELAFQGARAADARTSTKAFLAMPVTPPELFAAFFVMRLQTGAWNIAEGGNGQGEGQGTATSPT